MAINSAAFLRGYVSTKSLPLLLVICLCAGAAAQSPVVMPGSVVPLDHDPWGQIYHVVVSSHGDVLFLDTQSGALYQLLPDGKTMTTISGPGDVLKGGGSFWNAGMAIDTNDTIYITDRWDSAIHFLRVPYDPVAKSWPLTVNSVWGSLVGGGSGLNTNDIAIDDNNNLVISTETGNGIARLSVDASGNPGTLEWVVKGLKAVATKIAVDHDGNIFFIENSWTDRSNVKVGVWMIPAGVTGIVGDGSGTAEAQLVRVDPPAMNYNFKGITFDAAGNAYLSSAVDSYGGNYNMVLMVPKADIMDAAHTWSHAVMLSPVGSTAAITIDRRGYLWIPTGTGGWAPDGSVVLPGTLNVVKYVLGSADMGASPVGAAGAANTVFYSFSAATTPVNIVSTQTDFAAASNPHANANTTPPTPPCTPGTAYAAYSYCQVWLAMTPHIPGGVAGQIQMLGADGNLISGGAANLHGVGQGPQASILVPAAQTAIGNGFTAPKQVATDAAGNVYVADSGASAVLQYQKGSSSPVSIGTGLTAPTGVAFDGFGNLFIADSGKLIEVPNQSGTLNSAAQSVVKSGLGSSLSLAADGAGNVYVADPDNHRVVRVSNPATQSYLPGLTVTTGAGFSAPSAVAVDASGNVYVADGTSLHEVAGIGGQKAITSQLAGSAAGLAVDASGSVYVAQPSGLIRIPVNASGALSPNDAVSIAADTISSATSVALDSAGNLFASYGTEVSQLGISGLLDFGQVIPYAETDAEAQIFNIGNRPLSFSALENNVFSGAQAADFQIVAPADTPACDPATPTIAGASCYLGIGMTPAAEGTIAASLGIQSNAANASALTLNLASVAVADPRPATTTTVTYSPSSLTYPADVTITVTVASVSGSGTPTGSVTVSVSRQPKLTANLVNGVATFSYKQLQGGAYRVSVNYGGSGTDFAVSAGAATFTVNKAVSTTALAISPSCYVHGTCYFEAGTTHTLTATVAATAGIPTGAVVFTEGGAPADPAQPSSLLDANGVATFNTASLPKGLHTITAVYQSDANFGASTSPVGTFQVVDKSVLITTDSASMNLTAGTPGSVMLTLTPIVGFNDGVYLACTNLPNNSECTFSKPNPLVDQVRLISLTVSTNVPVNVGTLNRGTSTWAYAGLFAFGLIGLLTGKKTKHSARSWGLAVCAFLLIAGAVGGISGCSNSGYTKTPEAPHVTTPAGTYSVGLVATRQLTGETVSLPYTITVKVQ